MMCVCMRVHHLSVNLFIYPFSVTGAMQTSFDSQEVPFFLVGSFMFSHQYNPGLEWKFAKFCKYT